MTTVYIGMTADFFHHGHINILEQARQYGDIVIGLLTDEAIAGYKRLPYLNYEQRQRILENVTGVTEVVPQDDWSPAPNIRRYKPDYLFHGDDWLDGPLAPKRQMAIDALEEYGGQLIEVPYTKGVSSGELAEHNRRVAGTPDIRKKTLKRLLQAKPISRFIEVHSPLSALVAEKIDVKIDGACKQFDGFWSSSLSDSTVMGKPDIEVLDVSSRLGLIDKIFEVTTKPLIMDLDTGGQQEHFEINVRSLERLGISAVIIEDKTGLKKNSLFGTDVAQTQSDIETFCNKIRAGKANRLSSDFMIIARVESLILEKGMEDALERARAYVEAGADGIMIHSRKKQPDEILTFAKLFRESNPYTPLISVPTSYNEITDAELAESGFNIVIYANHMIRAAYPAMQEVAASILRHGRTAEVEDRLISIKEILELIPGTK